MGKSDKQQYQPIGKNSCSSGKSQEQLLNTLGDFTSKENWDQFFTIRGTDDSFEWYAEWPQIQNILTNHLSFHTLNQDVTAGDPPQLVESKDVAILVPGCGNSRLSEHLYDAGFKNITNLDFSKVVISDMLRRNVRERAQMKWRVMDMTDMQFENESFDAVVDKGGLDALMEPELGPRLGNQYLSEVKRLLKAGGRYICLTLGESHVLDLLFPKFRLGWKMSVYAIAMEPYSGNLNLQTFMVIAEKDPSNSITELSSFVNQYSIESHGNQAHELLKALEKEKRVRAAYSNGSDISYLLEDLKLGVKGNIKKLEPGRRIKLTLGEPGVSRFFYDSLLLDAQQEFGPFSYHFGVFLVPKARAHEWIYSSEEGQWVIVESSKAARLVMILLDSSNGSVAMEDIQLDLSPLVKQLAPEHCEDGVQIPFMAASDGIKQRKMVHQVTSKLTGPIVVDDVVYEKIDDDLNHLFPSKELTFRRLTFQRAVNLVQSEALLSTEDDQNAYSREADITKSLAGTKSRKKGKQRITHSCARVSRNEMKVNHNFLASSYHNGIVSGVMLFSFHLLRVPSAGGMVKAVVIGLGAGLLPTFLKKNLPSLQLEVIELDPVIFDVARDYFGFQEDWCLKVHITDGIKYIRGMADSKTVEVTATGSKKDNLLNRKLSNGQHSVHEQRSSLIIDVLIVDVDSSDSSSGLACPAADFVEESFLIDAKNSLSEQGLFVINLVSRSSTVKDAVLSRLKMVFSNLFTLQLDEDVNLVIFALKTNTSTMDDQFFEACNRLATSLELENQSWSKRVMDASKSIKRLR